MVVWLLGDYESDDFFKKQQNKKCSTTHWFSARISHLERTSKKLSMARWVLNFGHFMFQISKISWSRNRSNLLKRKAPWWKELWKQKDNLSSYETIIRSVYKPYIPYLVDAVFAVARPLHNMSEIHPISNLKKNSRNMSPLNE